LVKDILEEQETNINLCVNCEHYTEKMQTCTLKQKLMHEAQSCINFNIDTKKELITLKELKDKNEHMILRNQVYSLLIQKKRSESNRTNSKKNSQKKI